MERLPCLDAHAHIESRREKSFASGLAELSHDHRQDGDCRLLPDLFPPLLTSVTRTRNATG